MRGFVYALGECEIPPRRIILMNAGVRLAIEDSDSLEHLRSLAKLGVEILACGTCLEFFKLKEALALGRITNMYEIASLLLQGPIVAL
jgi:intracellular sulfur oxidation DsrE/DsrF family protein